MAITQVGSTLQYGIGSTANTGTVSSTITVPSDAEIVVVGVSGYAGNPGAYNSGKPMLEALTFTKGGVDTPMAKAYGADEANYWQAGLFYLVLPDTGTNKTLKWDWPSTGASVDGNFNFSVTFWKGIDLDSPVRDGDGRQWRSSDAEDASHGGMPFTLQNPLLAASGDKIIAFVGGFREFGTGDGAGTVSSFTNLTKLTDIPHNNYSEGLWATADPTAPTTVGIASVTSLSEGGLIALVLKPAGADHALRTGDFGHVASLKRFLGWWATLTAPSFTPTADALLVAVSTSLTADGEASSSAPSISGGGLTWTQQVRKVTADAGGWESTVYIWTAPVGASPASTTVEVVHHPDTYTGDGGYALDVFEITNPAASPVIQVFSDGGSSGRSGGYTHDFTTAPSETSILFGVATANNELASGFSVYTPGSGWTELVKNTNNYFTSHIQTKTGTTSPTVDWANLDPNINFTWAVAGIEIGVEAFSAPIEEGAADIDAVSSMTAAGTVIHVRFGEAGINATSGMTAAGIVVRYELGSAIILGTSGMTASGVLIRRGSTAIPAVSSMTAAAEVITPFIENGEFDVSGVSSVTVEAYVIRQGSATISGTSTITVAPSLLMLGTASFSATSEMTFAPSLMMWGTLEDIAAVSAMVAAGRTAYEQIQPDSTTWNTVGDEGTTWTPVTPDTNIWTEID